MMNRILRRLAGVLALMLMASTGYAQALDSLQIMEAARGGDLAAVQRLLEAGVRPDVRSLDGGTALVKAADRGYADVIAQDRIGRSVLMFAAAAGNEAVVRQALAAGADVNATDERFGVTALFAAAAEGHPTLVRLLLDAGADIHVRNKEDKTAIWYARERGHEEVVTLLEEAGASD